MARDLGEKLSANFTLGEMVASATAERDPVLLAAQRNPSDGVLLALRHLCSGTLQKIRESLNYPIHITSGYRSPALNQRVGGSNTSQHVFGQAADCKLTSRFLDDPRTASLRAEVEAGVRDVTREEIRPDANANFYLFAYTCLHLDELDIDQVIHEYGEGPGRPAWVHLTASASQNKRDIVRLGKDVPADQRHLDLEAALRLGTAAAPVDEVKESAMEQGANPGEFNVKSGEEVLIRVTAVRMGQLETVSSNATRVDDAPPPGHLYLVKPQGQVGNIDRVIIDCNFPDQLDPPGLYRFSVQSAAGGPVFEPPKIRQPSGGTFPQSATRTISFAIVA